MSEHIIKIKLLFAFMCQWRVGLIKKYFDENGRYKNLQLVDTDDYDYLVCWDSANDMNNELKYFNDQTIKKVILFSIEPKYICDHHASWIGAFREKYKDKVFFNLDPIECHRMPYSFLDNFSFLDNLIVKDKVISSIMDDKTHFDGHRLRVDFIKSIDCLDGWDHFGGNANPKYSRGRIQKKEDGLLRYKYHIACENMLEEHYFTEKITDALLCECFVFYAGCSNIEKFLHPKSFIKLDITDHTKSLAIIKDVIANNVYDEMLPYIKESKQRILEDYWPTKKIKEIIDNCG